MSSRALHSPSSPGVVIDPGEMAASSPSSASRATRSSSTRRWFSIGLLSGPFKAGIGGDQPLHALADECHGHLFVALHDAAAHHDPVPEAAMLDAISGPPRRILLRPERITRARRGEGAAAEIDLRALVRGGCDARAGGVQLAPDRPWRR